MLQVQPSSVHFYVVRDLFSLHSMTDNLIMSSCFPSSRWNPGGKQDIKREHRMQRGKAKLKYKDRVRGREWLPAGVLDDNQCPEGRLEQER